MQAEGIGTRVVSMPCMELFAAQDEAWRAQGAAAPARCASRSRRASGRAGTAGCWASAAREKSGFVGMHGFGASAPVDRLYEEFGITAEATVAKAKSLLGL